MGGEGAESFLLNMASSSKPNNSLSTICSQNDDEQATTSSIVYDKFFVIQATSDKTLSRISPFAIEKSFKAAVGTAQNVRRLRDGNILVEVANAAQSRSIINLHTLAECPVSVSPHRSLNTCKGVIRCRELLDSDKEEILTGLKSQGVVDIDNITVKDDSGSRRNTNTFIITFRLTTLPKHLKIGFTRVPVTVYIPNPLRCFNCQKFGHGKRNCKGRAICAKCSETGHSSDTCNNEAKCANCSGSHTAFSKDCPKWLLEKKVQRVKAEQGISFIEARRKVTAESEGRTAQGRRTAAAVVASNSSSRRPAASSIHVQTDLTWPDGQESPCTLPPTSTVNATTTSITTQTEDGTDLPSPKDRSGGAAGGVSAGGGQPPRQQASAASTSGKGFIKPQTKPSHHQTQHGKRPSIKRPPKADTGSRHKKKHHASEMDAVDYSGPSDSESEYPNPFFST